NALITPTLSLFPYTTLFRSRLQCVSPVPCESWLRGPGGQQPRLGRLRQVIRQAGRSATRGSRPRRSRMGEALPRDAGLRGYDSRSEEHTSELQSRVDLVCRL